MNQKQKFRVQVKKEKVNVRVGAIGGVVWSNRKVELDIEGVIIESKTDDDGVAEFILPVSRTDEATLLIYTKKETSKPAYKVQIKLGHLDPITEYSGQQARLTGLGYDCGSVTSHASKQYEESVLQFQKDYGLTADGVCGPDTQAKLEKEYGC